MPTVLRTSGYRFFFYSLEGSEPPHIHVEHGDSAARGFRSHQINRLRALVIEHRATFLETWNAHFGR
jgi:hypothetical protein